MTAVQRLLCQPMSCTDAIDRIWFYTIQHYVAFSWTVNFIFGWAVEQSIHRSSLKPMLSWCLCTSYLTYSLVAMLRTSESLSEFSFLSSSNGWFFLVVVIVFWDMFCIGSHVRIKDLRGADLVDCDHIHVNIYSLMVKFPRIWITIDENK